MEPDFWQSRWEAGQIGFHVDGAHPDLLAQADTFLAGGPHRVLVPLCGKSHDLRFLVEEGHDTVGVELVRKAVEELHREQRRQPEVEEHAQGATFRSPGLTVHCCDVLGLTPEAVGTFDRVWDRAAVVALRPDQRRRYTRVIRSLVRPGGQVLVNTFIYDQSKMPGPPHSVPEAELREHYAGWDFEVIRHGEPMSEGRFAERGVDAFRVDLYRITRPA
jgi:thiopurine S-methyltransferase